MRPLHDPLQATGRAGATTLEVWQPIFSPALPGRLQAIVRQSFDSPNVRAFTITRLDATMLNRMTVDYLVN